MGSCQSLPHLKQITLPHLHSTLFIKFCSALNANEHSGDGHQRISLFFCQESNLSKMCSITTQNFRCFKFLKRLQEPWPFLWEDDHFCITSMTIFVRGWPFLYYGGSIAKKTSILCKIENIHGIITSCENKKNGQLSCNQSRKCFYNFTMKFIAQVFVLWMQY